MSKIKRMAMLSILCVFLFSMAPLGAVAEDTLPPEETSTEETESTEEDDEADAPDETTDVKLPPVVITEVQTSAGPGEATREFIELYNTTEDDIVLDAPDGGEGWRLWYMPSTRTEVKGSGDYTSIALSGEIPAGEHFLIAKNYDDDDGDNIADEGGYLAGAKVDAVHSATLAASGNLWLLGPDSEEACKLLRYDALGWGNDAQLGEGDPAANPEGGISIGRLVDDTGRYVDTGRNSLDFDTMEPGDEQEETESQVTPGEPNVVEREIPASTEPPAFDPETVNAPLLVNQSLCEAVPGPENPGQLPPPQEESPPSVIEPPEGSGSGGPVIPASNKGLKTPLLSELLPNPAMPQTDKDDEFIELYNPNDKPFDLSGYMLEAGLKTKRRYTIPQGTKIAPRKFKAFFSADTSIALTNSGGQVALIDPLGKVLAVSDAYGTAKDGHAWVFADGKWQWTTKPTPNAVNVVSAPADKSSKKTSSSSSGTAGAGSSSRSVSSEDDLDEAEVLGSTSETPLHPGVLALVAVSALLYGAYEYRHDVANKLYQFRSNRAARRAARQGAEGR